MFEIIESFCTFSEFEKTRIDYATFRLHYIFTAGLLLIFFVIVTTFQLAGNPLACETSNKETVPAILTYCWIHSTFVIPKAFYKNVPSDIAHPGIDSTQNPKKFRYITYYRWVYFMLFFQAVLFYTPRWLWKTWEGGKMKSLTKGFNNVLLPGPKLNEEFEALSRYLVKTLGAHDYYAAKYYLCELLSLLNIMAQFFLLDLFFSGQYIDFGVRTIKFYSSEYYHRQNKNGTFYIKGNPMIILFPRVSKCVYRTYGSTSDIDVQDVICVLTLNVVNEKIYIFLWFWFVILGILTVLSLIFDFFLIISWCFRLYALQARFYLVDRNDFRILVRKGSFGDWLILDLIGRNVNHVVFSNLMSDVANKMTAYYRKL
ncbi:innexin shaking-B [Trichonephila clavata]|uniref:Innexin n=1 Tax=Trichonephila clavata TaxID=2740835 RepID=A0A8X6FHF6_TRICU|nr:innexin shaking-B [Trichonephila clavata]